MIITFSSGKVIATAHELVVKLSGPHRVSLQSQIDAVSLIGKGANVIVAHGSETTWSVKLDNQEQLLQIAQQIGIDIQ
ncbi:DUF3389 domain-containing protein [Vibrio sinaloensis]|uniref:DUF3389 domain-containing protein n=1 Tax=Photobacterium sp. (strain ATCC 43367) TaxID=379097 RepID=UPI002061E8F4|nr:DUF3389 domain-containing protein [Vibrio sinaloensis]UPQ89893.1 DUF3389 domain-containing protein [Vibrio sinaloensis]